MKSELIFIQLEENAKAPQYAHDDDAGADVFAYEDTVIPARGHAAVRTGVKVALHKGLYGKMSSKSGLMVKHGLTCDGTIDAGYRGEIMAIMFNHTDVDYVFHRGDKVAQLIILPYVRSYFEEADELDGTERGAGGFGSTGK